MADLFQIERTECIGNSLPKINGNFDAINNDLSVLTQAVDEIATAVENLSAAEEATRIYVNNPSFYKESNFVYGFRNVGYTPGLANVWRDVYINQFLDPLKIQIRVDIPKTVMLYGRVHLRHVANTTSTWIRLARFDSASREIDPVEVLDIVSSDSMRLFDTGTAVCVQAPYVLEPGVDYVFGLQTYFWKDPGAVSLRNSFNAGTRLYSAEKLAKDGQNALTGPIIKRKAAKKSSKKGSLISSKEQLNVAEIYQIIISQNAASSSVIINGWSADDPFSEQFNNTKSLDTLQDVQAVNKYNNDGKSGVNRIGKATAFGYAYDEQAIRRQVKNISFIRAVVL